MATGNKRDVRLAVEIDTVGEESLRRTGDELKRLAKEGGAAAPELAALAAQFDKLADQSGALATFRQLGTEIERLKASQTEAAATVGLLGDKLAAAQAAAAPLVERQRELTLSTLAAREANAKLGVGLVDLDAQFKANKVTQERYDDALAASKKTRAENVALIASNTLELAKQRPALEAAVAAEEKLRRQYEAQQAEVAKANQALRQRESALKGASEAALAAGAATTDLAASEAELLRTTQEAVDARRRLSDGMEQSALAARLADAEFAKNVTTLRELDAAATALGEADSAAAMQKLEQGAREADAQFDKLVASLRAAETAAEEYAAATARAAGASRDDAQALQARQAAAQRLLNVEQALTAEQREVAAARDAGRAAILAEAQALLQQAAAARESQAATVAAAQAARQAGAAIESAFGAVGIRSIDAIEQEIEQTGAALARLSTQARAGGIGLDDLNRAAGAAEAKIARLRAEIAQVQSAPGTFERLSTGLNGLVTRFGALTAAIATVGVAVRPVIESFIALEQTARILTTITGSTSEAARQIEFLRATAQQSGQSFDTLSVSYSKFAASALQTGLSIKDTQEVFASVASAAGNLGLSSDQAGRALEALSQIASKGVVTMEELRGQLGDALPGALPLLAKELGLTTRELSKVVESGGLLAFEAIPAIGRALRALGTEGGKEVTGLRAEFQRFVDDVKLAGVSVLNSSFGGGLGRALGVVAGLLRTGALYFTVFAEKASVAVDVVGLAYGKMTGRVEDFGARYEAVLEASDKRVRKFADEMRGSSKAADDLADSARKTAGSLAALNLRNQEAVDSVESLVRASVKNVEAKKAEAQASVTLSELIGDENTKRTAQVASADLVAKALREQFERETELVGALKRSRGAIVERTLAERRSLDAIKGTLAEFDKKIASADADAKKTFEQANAQRALAISLDLTAEKAKDNSGRIEELKKELKAAGTSSEALARAQGLLRDAIDDVTEALNRKIGALQADNNLLKAQLTLELEKAKNAQREAQDLGNVTAARQASIRVREIEQQITRAGIVLKDAEAQATITALSLQLKELEALGQLTPERRVELETKIKNAEASRIEAQATRESTKAKDDEIAQLRVAVPLRSDLSGAVEKNSGTYRENTREVATNTTVLGSNAAALRTIGLTAEQASLQFGKFTGEYQKNVIALNRADQARREALEASTGANFGSSRGGVIGIGGGSAAGSSQGAGRSSGSASGNAFGSSGVRYSENDLRDGYGLDSRANKTQRADEFAADRARFDAERGSVRQGGSFYTPPPDNSGDWYWTATTSRPGGEWLLTAAGQANQAKRQAEELRGYAVRAGQSDYFDPVTQRRVSTGVAEAREAQMRAGFEASLARTPSASAAPGTDPGGPNGSAGYSPLGSFGRSQQPQSPTALADAERMQREAANLRAGTTGLSTVEANRRAQENLARSPGAYYTVNVTIGGQQRTIGATSKASADALIAALEEAYRAGGGG